MRNFMSDLICEDLIFALQIVKSVENDCYVSDDDILRAYVYLDEIIELCENKKNNTCARAYLAADRKNR